MEKTAIVTGSSRGIGRAIALALAKEGFNVVINGKNKKNVYDTVKYIEKFSDTKILPIVSDISNYKQAYKLIQTTIKKLKKVDVLINNAGTIVVNPLTKTSYKDWKQVLDTNLNGTFYCCKEILPHLKSHHSGLIINMSSGAGRKGFENLSAYCASKFAVNGFSECLSKELKKYKIRVITLCPDRVATDMQKEFFTLKEFKKHRKNMLQPNDIAKIVIQIVKGKFKTGSVVEV